jgi:hypothetical protein
MNKDDNPEVGLLWTREQEELLKDWCDIANCFRWLHEQASFKYRKINNRIALPVIILSTLTGTANFGMKSLVPESAQQLASALVGGVNIFCGILTTIQTYFRYAELTEGHSSASKMWSKFQRLINIELAIEPSKRRHPNDFLKFCIDEYDKLKELSPTIPKDIANEFRVKFKKTSNVFKPDIYDHLGQTLTYVDYVSRNKNKNESRNDMAITDIDELQSIRIDSDEDTRQYKSIPYPGGREIIGNKITGVINKSIRDKKYSMDVQRPSKDPKGDLENELKALRPNIKGLISRLNGIHEELSIDEIGSRSKEIFKDTNSKDVLSMLSGKSDIKSADPSGKLDGKSDIPGVKSSGKSADPSGKSETPSGKSGVKSDISSVKSDSKSDSKSETPSGKSETKKSTGDLTTDVNIESVKNI